MFNATNTITQPVFSSTQADLDDRIVEVEENAFIQVNAYVIKTKKEIPVTLTMHSNKNILDGEFMTTDFTIVFGYCPTNFDDAISGNHVFSYFLRSETTELFTFESWDSRVCTSTGFTAELLKEAANVPIVSAIDPPDEGAEPSSFFSLEQTAFEDKPNSATLFGLEMDSMENIGQYSITVTEYFLDNQYQEVPLEFSETVEVNILDPCILSEIDYPSSFSVFYDEDA